MSEDDADGGLLSWHDNPVYGIHWRCADPDRNLWRSELVLDIDHILEWVPPAKGGWTFLVAPALLVFHDAADLAISLDCTSGDAEPHYLNELTIDHICREAAPGEKTDWFRWRIELNQPKAGGIGFLASRFSQTLSAPPLLCDEQRYPGNQRPPFALAVLP
jgi:hypothetical protein